MVDHALHADLIGQPGGRARLNTPALVIDVDALDRNIAAMAELAQRHGVALRPHAKTHKSVDIAHRQIAAGAIGLCCAKLGEAEVLAAGGITSLHITSPVTSPPAIERLAALAVTGIDLMVVADHATNVAALSQAMAAANGETGIELGIIVDIDPGIHRTGVASAADAVALAQAIVAQPGLSYRGVQFYCGVQQHIESFAERGAAIADCSAYLRTVIAALDRAGLAPAIVTGSGTGTHRIDLAMDVFTELQVGSYVFMDRQYRDCDLTGDGGAPFATSLFVDTRVVSANTAGMVTIDAGFKALATDGGPATVHDIDGLRFIFMGDEHGALIGARADGLRLGGPVALTVPHCDPTVNLYDVYHVVRGDTVIAIWPVSARGRSQ